MNQRSTKNRAEVPPELADRVEAWISEDPDPQTRHELTSMLATGDVAALKDRFDHPLTFGTAGLRAPLGAGPARMNRAVVRRTTAGLARWVLEQGEEAADAGIVVGYDARHGSATFARDTAAVAASAGLKVRRFNRPLPTPITAYAVLHFAAAAGVMVTASHNPAPDNGYKVYVADGSQVIPPDDEAIAAASTTVDPSVVDFEVDRDRKTTPSIEPIGGIAPGEMSEQDEAELLDGYRDIVLGLLDRSGPRRLRTVYTPLHGVGGAVLPGLLEEAGFAPAMAVAAQAEPNPDFPTAPFPNPEEPGVLDLALAEAAERGADLVLANDPDADRLAVAVPDSRLGGWRQLSGDELGWLLADHLISTTTGPERLVAASVVSSTMLSQLAAAAGVAYVETLTGFKWIARAARLRPGHRLLFGYEEAFGYLVTDAVADKDGISAALVAAEIAALAISEGDTLLDRLDRIQARLGVHETSQLSMRLSGTDAPARMAAVIDRWRGDPPDTIAGLEVTGMKDLAQGVDELPVSNVLIFELGQRGRVVIRPSGTEPKLKVYIEAMTAPTGLESLQEGREEARELREQLAKAVSERCELP